MSDNNIILKAENVSKQYRLGVIGTGTISHDLNRWWQKVRGNEDPYLKIGEVNDRAVKGNSEFVWALKDINFEVKRGEVLGIIGKNGAGKSTLLKILSRVTGPTTGIIKSRGRIASLLEVGTGFHPELTGRENIFLNGAILGMTKAEIKAKLEEIIDFSGCQRYVDTPVKRYSSGMRVRLGFAVAAFLEPDILVVDEVLAVGDAEFQKKAIGKMQDISEGGGKTVLFVSHNMASVSSLCTRGLVLENGMVKFQGPTGQAVSFYLNGGNRDENLNIKIWQKGEEPISNGVKLLSVKIFAKGNNEREPIRMDHSIIMETSIELEDIRRDVNCTFQFIDETGRVLFVTNSKNATFTETKEPSIVHFSGEIPSHFFNEGKFLINLLIVEASKVVLIKQEDIIELNVGPAPKELGAWMGKSKGLLKPKFTWQKRLQ